MATTKTITHGGHDHVVKETKVEVSGIKIDTSETHEIDLAFGWEEGKLEQLFKSLEKFHRFQMAAEDLEPDLPKGTKLSVLADFLKSDFFRRLEIKMENPNDYILLGLVWGQVVCSPRMDMFGSSLLDMLKKMSNES